VEATSVQSAPAEISKIKSSQFARLIVSSFIGTSLESFDFNIYTLLTPLVFNRLFFPQLDPAIATIASFSVLAVGLFSRPLGGVLLGHFGDRIGRKPTMVFTLLLIGVSTALIGLIPTYDTIGIWAPVILTVMRFLQGIAFGGETSAAPVLVSESTSARWRGTWSALATTGILGGVLPAAAVVAAVAQLPNEEMLSWGWRVPFVGSLAVVLVGIYIRLKVEESPIFTAKVAGKKALRLPIAEVLRNYKKPTVIAMLISMSQSGIFFFTATFGLSYAVQNLHLQRDILLEGLMIGNAIGTFTITLCGWLSDIIGRRPVMASCFIGSALYVWLGYFQLMETGQTFYVMLAVAVSPAILQPLSLGPGAALFSEYYSDARLRFSGFAIGKQLGNVIGGGLLPVLSASVLAATNNSLSYVIVLFGILNMLSTVATYMMPETKNTGM